MIRRFIEETVLRLDVESCLARLRETLKTSLSFQQEQSLGGLELTEIVIDSSILAKFVLRESGWEEVEDIMSKRLYILELAVKEVVNAIWKRVTLVKDIGVERVFVLLSYLLELKKRLAVCSTTTLEELS